MPKQDRIPELVEELRHFFADVPLVMEAADTIEDLMDVAEHYKECYHEEHDLRMLAIKERNELKFENEILNDGVDDLKAEVKRLEEVRDKALKRLCDWCGVCPEEKRDPLDCDDIAMLWEAREDEE